MFLGGQRWRKKWPRTAQGTDAWMLGTGTGMGLGRQAGRASTRESPLVHCALCVWCVVCGARYVVRGTWYYVVLVVGNALLPIDVASKFYPKDAEAFDEYLQIDFESQRCEIRCDT